jgi:hypothetical protein
MDVFLLFCLCFSAGAFAQEQAGKQVVFKTICGKGMSRCTVKMNCTWIIDAADKGIQIIDDQALAGCVEAGDLDLSHNKISEISKIAFQGLRKLRELNLNYNQIKILMPGVFDPLTSLTVLRLSENFIEVIEDSLFSKNENLEYLYLNENKIFAVGPNAFQNLSKLKALWIFGNPCMHPNVTWETNSEKLGVFSYSGSGNQKWKNRNTCVLSYDINGSAEESNIEKENLTDVEEGASDCDRKLETLSGISENCKRELSEAKARNQNFQEAVKNLTNELTKNQNHVKTCTLEKQKISEDHKKDLLDVRLECKAENDQVISKIAECDRKNQTIVLSLSIIIILLLIIITVGSVMICKYERKKGAKKEEIIRLDCQNK